MLDKLSTITGIKPSFYQIDVKDEAKVEAIFNNHKIDGVIHFAGLKAVGESVSKPLEYYYNNLISTMVLSKMCVKYGVGKFVFSSSATVYGDQPSPLKEDMELKKTTNPYGETKAMSERILTDTSIANPNFAVSLLRYFNPVGAHESGLIGEDPNGIPNNLMPFVTKVAKGQLEKLSVFGNDYDTIDGTGVRDYIHFIMRICNRCIMDESDPNIVFDEKGYCNHCTNAITNLSNSVYGLDKDMKKESLRDLIGKIKKSGEGKNFDCIVGLSGGVDSSYTLYLFKKWGLRPLAVHADNHWNSNEADENITNLVRMLEVPLVHEKVDWDEFKDMQLAFLRSSTPDSEVPSDNLIFAILYKIAKKHRINYIMAGYNSASESILPRAWSQGHF